MSGIWENYILELLGTDNLSKKSEILSEMMKLTQKGFVLNCKILVDCLLYAKEQVNECKTLSLLIIQTLKHDSFKAELSGMSVIYHYALNGLSSGCSKKIPQVLNLLTALCYPGNLSRNYMKHKMRDNDASVKNCHVVAKDSIRTSGCLQQMCMLFIQLNADNAVWRPLCDCLIESCTSLSENQDHSSHILPKCLRELTYNIDNCNVKVINLLIALIYENPNNCDKFVILGGVYYICRNLLRVSEAMELLHLLINQSNMAVQQVAQMNLLDVLNEQVISHRRSDSFRDLKLLHWITRIIFTLANNDDTPSDQPNIDIKINNKPSKEEKHNEKNYSFILPKKKNIPKTKSRKHALNTSYKDEKNIRKMKLNNEWKTESFRSKYDAISNTNISADASMRTVLKSRRALSDVTNINKKYRNLSQFVENFKIENVGNFSRIFTPKHFSTPLKYNESNISQSIPNERKKKLEYKSNQKKCKTDNMSGDTFEVENQNENCQIIESNTLNSIPASLKVKKFVEDVVKRYHNEENNQNCSNSENDYVFCMNTDNQTYKNLYGSANNFNLRDEVKGNKKIHIKSNSNTQNGNNDISNTENNITTSLKNYNPCDPTKDIYHFEINDSCQCEKIVDLENIANSKVSEHVSESHDFKNLLKDKNDSNINDKFKNIDVANKHNVSKNVIDSEIQNVAKNEGMIMNFENMFCNLSTITKNEDNLNHFQLPFNLKNDESDENKAKMDATNIFNLDLDKNNDDSTRTINSKFRRVHSDISSDSSSQSEGKLDVKDGTCCKNGCKAFKRVIRRLKKGISLHGLNFHIICKTLWPKDPYITPTYLQDIYCNYIIRK